jgi:transcriptional regulator with XRE-family HTH domain
MTPPFDPSVLAGNGTGGPEPDPVDRHIGRRLRLRRAMLGLPRAVLARDLRLDEIRLMAHETGSAPLSVALLVRLAQALDTPIGFFLEDAPALSAAVRPPGTGEDPLRVETRALLRDYYRLAPDLRRRIARLIKAMRGDAG